MDMDTVRQLQALARGRRIELGLSQEALASRAGLSRKWISEFERGKTSIDLSLFVRLITALDLRLQLVGSDTPRIAPADLPPTDGVDLDAYLEGFLDR